MDRVVSLALNQQIRRENAAVVADLYPRRVTVFAYVDIFSLYRPDFRADVEAGEIGGFTVNQSFLLGTTLYVVIPSLMVFGALVLRPRVNRIVNTTFGFVYALTIIAGAIDEWHYYILGSAIEVALLAAVVYYAWTWPKLDPPTSATGWPTAHHIQRSAFEIAWSSSTCVARVPPIGERAGPQGVEVS